MGRAGVAVDAAMLAAAVSIDAGVKANVRAVIVGNDATWSHREKIECGEKRLSSLPSGGSGIRSIDSKRFFGLLADPRPRTPRGAFIESIRQPEAPLGQPALSVPRARRPWQPRPSWLHAPDDESIV